jgi:hypothetical protein
VTPQWFATSEKYSWLRRRNKSLLKSWTLEGCLPKYKDIAVH